MSKKIDKLIKDFFQKPYDFFKNLAAPKFFVKISQLILKYITIPKLLEIIQVAYKLSNEVENDTVPGYVKKEKVVSGINEFIALLGISLSKTIINFIAELVALYIKIEKE